MCDSQGNRNLKQFQMIGLISITVFIVTGISVPDFCYFNHIGHTLIIRVWNHQFLLSRRGACSPVELRDLLRSKVQRPILEVDASEKDDISPIILEDQLTSFT
jgi:hypothetical protein